MSKTVYCWFTEVRAFGVSSYLIEAGKGLVEQVFCEFNELRRVGVSL